ncbi:Uncharacterized protein APZ42_024477 [Daphnia magna]|uniref:Uncharacterized protein n=1 Tax=Daphnia magna TaxID=35525 RepID=A0A162DF65_9CRUS|nr:Uncharacterized protein APZ42_024477 [Daphnia magna]
MCSDLLDILLSFSIMGRRLHTAHKDRFICFFFASSNQTGPSVSWPTCLVVMSFFLFGGWGCPSYRDILKERL